MREEFYSVYNKQLAIMSEQERISKDLEYAGDDMKKMQVKQCCSAEFHGHITSL